MPETVGFIKGFFRDNRAALRVAFASVLVMAGFAFFAAQFSTAQTFSGRGIDMRALEGQAADCRRPALDLNTQVIVLRQSIQDILECNASGGFAQRDGSCVPAVSPGHLFSKDESNPDNRDGLSFGGGPFGLIGGADGKDVTCAPVAECTDPCDPGAELNEGDQTSLVYNDTRACGGDCQSTRLTCGADGSLSDPPAGWSGIACECPHEECDGCTDPCTGASLDDGDTTGFLYKEPRACGESCTSTHLTCENGTLTDPPSDWEDTVCSCPDENCGGCLADTLSWTVSGNTCEGGVPSADDGDTETATNNLPGLTGEADFTCSDEEWGSPTNASCEPVVPVTCPADSNVSWAPGCMASLSETNAPDDVTVTDNTGDYTGSATYPCQSDGTWGDPTNTSCDGPDECNDPCGAGIIADGDPVTVYEKETLSCGQSATEVTLTCSDGNTGFNNTDYTCTEPTPSFTYTQLNLSGEDQQFGCTGIMISCSTHTVSCDQVPTGPLPIIEEGEHSCDDMWALLQSNCAPGTFGCGCDGL